MLILGIFVLVFALAVLSISAYTGWKMLHPEKASLQAFSANVAPDYMDISFSSADKTKLSGWYFPAKASDKTVILAHSYGKNRMEFGQETISIVKQLMENSFNVLAFDFRNSGNSSGSLTTFGLKEKEDLDAAIFKAKSLGSKHIVLMGFSTGASTCLLSAAENPDVEAVIADSPYADIKDYLQSEIFSIKLPDFPFDSTMLFFMNLFAGVNDSVSPANILKNIAPRPVLVIWGTEDETVSVESYQELKIKYSRAGSGRLDLWEAEGAAHAKSYEKQPEAYMEKVLDFLKDVYPTESKK